MRYIPILLFIFCTACGTALPTIKPYKLDVQQGNAVTSKMLLQLRPGMSKSQVRFIMGTPLIQDSFHGNRWDYVYSMREQGKITEQRRVILDFDHELLKSVRGDVIPSGTDKDKSGVPANNSGIRVINPSAKPQEKSIFGKLKFWEKDESTLTKEAADAKAKADADEAAKKATDKASKVDAAPAKTTKTILTVPEVMPIMEPVDPAADSEAVAPITEEAPAAEAGKKPESAIEPHSVIEPVQPEIQKSEPVKVNLAPVNTVPADAVITKKAVVVEKTEPKAKETEATSESYDSTSGMKFDNAMKTNEVNDVSTAQEIPAPRAGNKTIPKPKDLPEESKLGFFDRMLEKIGF